MFKLVQDETVMIPKSEYEDLKAVEAHYEELHAMGVDNWEGYFGSQRDCIGCGKYYDWNIQECPECFVDLPGPHD